MAKKLQRIGAVMAIIGVIACVATYQPHMSFSGFLSGNVLFGGLVLFVVGRIWE